MHRIESSKSASKPFALAFLVVIPEGDLRFVLLPEIETFVWYVAQTAAAFGPIVMPSSNHAQPAPLNAGCLGQPHRYQTGGISALRNSIVRLESLVRSPGFSISNRSEVRNHRSGHTARGTSSSGTGINDFGEVTGVSDAAQLTGGDVHAFLYSNGTMLDLGTLPGQSSSIGRGINLSGQVVGYTTSGQNTNFRPFLCSDGIMKDLNDLIPKNSGWSFWYAFAINDRGQITGHGSHNGAVHAFPLTPHARTTIEPE
jgi:probable HAF family extracellular repeat protein